MLTPQFTSDWLTRSGAVQVVTDAAVALNGWNPLGNPRVGIFLDAQTGSIAAVDELKLGNPIGASDQAETGAREAGASGGIHFGFEPPSYLSGQDVIGLDGWETSSFGAAPATSMVAVALKDARLSKLEHQLATARRIVQRPELGLRAAAAKLLATRDQLRSLEARIAADRAKYQSAENLDAIELARAAARLERTASMSQLEAEVLAGEYALAAAESKPPRDASRQQEIDSAVNQLAASRDSLAKTRAANFDEHSETYSALSPVYPRTSTGRRKALAGWIASRHNPLTGRVAVNHIWSRHFHAPLVDSVYDFGLNGSRPTHPELLDWLAVELIESGWSMKHIHRLIVTSEAYRRSSQSQRSDASATDGTSVHQQDIDNRLLWRMNTGRMEAEVIRDSLLHCSHLLDLTRGGASLDNTQAMNTYRRSLYYEIYPDGGGTSEFGSLFDSPSPLECYRRTRSIVPQQSLALTNSDLVHKVAGEIVIAWDKKSTDLLGADSDRRFVTEMFEQILTRLPTEMELNICMDGLSIQRELLTQDDADQKSIKARESLVRVLLNHNDFVTVR